MNLYLIRIMCLILQLRELKSKLCQENEESSQVATEVEEETPVSEQSKNQDLCDDVNAQLLISSPASSTTLHFTGSSSSSLSSMNWVQLSDPRTTLNNAYHHQQSHFVKVEEQSLFNSDASCNFFSVDQPPTLQWYFTGQ